MLIIMWFFGNHGEKLCFSSASEFKYPSLHETSMLHLQDHMNKTNQQQSDSATALMWKNSSRTQMPFPHYCT